LEGACYGELQFGEAIFPYARFEKNLDNYEMPIEMISAVESGSLERPHSYVQIGEIQAQGYRPTDPNIWIPVYAYANGPRDVILSFRKIIEAEEIMK